MRVWYIEAVLGETVEDLFIQSDSVLSALVEARRISTIPGGLFTVR